MKILLAGNYEPDAQQSMLRFGEMLARRLAGEGHAVTVSRPRSRWRRWTRGTGGAAKWAGYVDKYVLYPRELHRHAAGQDLVHVIDHSNAVYIPRRPAAVWVATCHDLLAVRGALGEDTDCPASRLGRRLQRSIVAGLGRAAAIACDSTSTRADLDRLVVPRVAGQRRCTILLGLNRDWALIGDAEAAARLTAYPQVPWHEPYLLHVGSVERRKNRPALVRLLARLRARWPGNVVFCGAGLTSELEAAARTAGLRERVFAVEGPDDATLEALYRRAHALVFPSKCEGFGWPVIEAQACGCPVICSDRTSLPEVAGAGGLVFALDDEAGMAAAVLQLRDAAFRAEVVRRGHANVARFAADRMGADYATFYAEALTAPRS